MLMKTWILSANPSIYNHQKAFDDNGYIDWKQTRNFEVGDIVYIYCTKPVSRIQYKTTVVQVGMKPYRDEYWNKKAAAGQLGKKYMRLNLISFCDTEELSMENLKRHGMLYPPQSPGFAKEELIDYITPFFEKGLQ